MIPLRRVRRQLGGGKNAAQEKPVAELARDKDRVLALPSDAGGFRQRLLHDGRRIDEHLNVGRGADG